MANIKEPVSYCGAAGVDALLEIRTGHAEAIDRGYQQFSSLLNELMLESGDPEMYNELETLLDQSNFESQSRLRMDKLKAIYHKISSLPARVHAAKNLTDMLAMLIRMQTQALAPNVSSTAVNRMHERLDKIGQKVRKGLDSISKPVRREE